MVHFQSKCVLGEKSGGEAGKAHHARMIKILLGPSTIPDARQGKNAIALGHKRAFDSSLSWSCRVRESARTGRAVLRAAVAHH